jgi:hypothetical protein
MTNMSFSAQTGPSRTGVSHDMVRQEDTEAPPLACRRWKDAVLSCTRSLTLCLVRVAHRGITWADSGQLPAVKQTWIPTYFANNQASLMVRDVCGYLGVTKFLDKVTLLPGSDSLKLQLKFRLTSSSFIFHNYSFTCVESDRARYIESMAIARFCKITSIFPTKLVHWFQLEGTALSLMFLRSKLGNIQVGSIFILSITPYTL